MFTRAGFRQPVRCLAYAKVSHEGGRGVVWGYLMRWASGDLAWASETKITWPEQVHIHCRFHIRGSYGLPHSDLRTRRTIIK